MVKLATERLCLAHKQCLGLSQPAKVFTVMASNTLPSIAKAPGIAAEALKNTPEPILAPSDSRAFQGCLTSIGSKLKDNTQNV